MNKFLAIFRYKSTSSSYNKNQSSTYAVMIFPFTVGDNISHRHKILCEVQFHCQSVIIYFISFNEGKTRVSQSCKKNM